MSRDSLFDRLVAGAGQANASGGSRWCLQSQLERVLGTRRTPLGIRAGASAAESQERSKVGLDDDRLLTFGLDYLGRAVVTLDVDLRMLEKVVRSTIRRHLPWVSTVQVKAGPADASKDGKVVVPLEISVGAHRGTTIRLRLHRLARQLDLPLDGGSIPTSIA